MNSITKKCTKCGCVKEITCFHKDVNRKDGYFPQCKECVKSNSRHWYTHNKTKSYETGRRWRLENREKDNENRRNWIIKNIEAVRKKAREYSRNWRVRNPEKAHERDRKYNATRDKEEMRKSKRIEYHKDIEKTREKNRQYRLKNWEKLKKEAIERTKQWRRDNPEKRAEQQRNRRAQKAGNGGKITAQEWEDLKRHYNYTCLKCKRKEPEIKITLDHVMPLKLGGSHTIDNAQPLCFSCNSSKQAKHIDYR